jgi:hypothetical protein
MLSESDDDCINLTLPALPVKHVVCQNETFKNVETGINQDSMGKLSLLLISFETNINQMERIQKKFVYEQDQKYKDVEIKLKQAEEKILNLEVNMKYNNESNQLEQNKLNVQVKDLEDQKVELCRNRDQHLIDKTKLEELQKLNDDKQKITEMDIIKVMYLITRLV